VQLPFVSALLVLDSDGARIAVKYWDPTLVSAKAGEELKAQFAFEKKVFAKTVRNQQRPDGYDTIRKKRTKAKETSRSGKIA
jgi:hypothetical protein